MPAHLPVRILRKWHLEFTRGSQYAVSRKTLGPPRRPSAICTTLGRNGLQRAGEAAAVVVRRDAGLGGRVAVGAVGSRRLYHKNLRRAFSSPGLP